MSNIFGNGNISSLHSLSDEELSAKVKSGETNVFEILYERYKDKIFSYIRNILNYNHDDASNVLSETFIKVFEYIKKGEIKAFKTFIYKIAHNTSIDRIRANKSKIFAKEDVAKLIEDEQSYIQKDQLDNQFKQQIMMDCLSQIDEKFRNVLFLYYFEEKSYDEIADIVGSNKNSIGTMIFNAKKQLKEKIKDENILKALMS